MRIALMTLTVLALTSPAQAGVYNLAEEHPTVPPEEVRKYITNLRSAAEARPGLPLPESFRAMVLRLVAELELSKANGEFSPLDRISLSGAYLRLGRIKDALDLLTDEDNKDNKHFMHQANLASAYFLSGNLEMARRTQQRVLDLWPAVQFGWTEQERLFNRECEKMLLLLFEKRDEESKASKTNDLPIDPIFPRLRFVGPHGTYLAGDLSPAMRDRLPLNGINIVFQLCKWYPTERRLYWQLAELLNVHGQIEQASGMLDELVDGGNSGKFQDLPAHRRVLRAALPAYREIQDPTKRGMLLSQLLLIPRPMPGAPVIGEIAYTAGCCATITMVPYWDKPTPPVFPPGPVVGPSEPVFEWRHLFTTFSLGFLIAALAGWQLQVWRGRKSVAG